MRARRPSPLLLLSALLALAAPAAASAQAEVSPCAVPGPAAAELGPGLEPGPHAFHSNGVRLFYCVAGEGPADAPPVVFLHGGPGEGGFRFAALMGPRLERGLRMVYFDQRGSGRSQKPADRSYTLEGLVDDVEALRRALGVPKVALVAHSFGGVLLLEYAAKHPQHVSRAVLAAGLSDLAASGRSMCRRLAEVHPEAHARVVDAAQPGGCNVFAALRGEEREAFFRGNMFPDPAIAVRVDSAEAASGIRNTGEMSSALFSRGFLRWRFTGHERVRLPVLVLAGRHDHQVGMEGPEALVRDLPDARLVVYDRSGHFLYADEPDRFARDVIAFLGGGAGR